MLYGDLAENRRIQAGIHRPTQFLSLHSEWDFEEGAGPPVHQSVALQEQERLRSGVLPQRYEQTHRCQRILGHQQPIRGTAESIAFHRRYSKIYHSSKKV